MSSKIVCKIPLFKIFSIMQSMFGKGEFVTFNEKQVNLLKQYSEHKFREQNGEISSLVAKTAEEINDFLKKNGLNIELEPFESVPGWESIGIAAILDVFIKWISEPSPIAINRSYKGLRFSADNVTFYSCSEHPSYPIIKLDTRPQRQVLSLGGEVSSAKVPLTTQDEIWITPVIWGLSLKDIDKFDKAPKHAIYYYNSLHVPTIKFDYKPDISWLKGFVLSSPTVTAMIKQAVQQNKFAMNEKGVSVKSGAAVEVAVSGCSTWKDTPFVIDQPFFLWLKRDGYTYLKAYFDAEAWERID